MRIEEPAMRRKWHSYIGVTGSQGKQPEGYRCKSSRSIPSTAVTGVSGSGKSTLVHDIFFNRPTTPGWAATATKTGRLTGTGRRYLRASPALN
ncbi:MAG: hypothetical protein MZV63_00580 [Marinilabiliales bacterium]|nr:hypothetical protein [Marinilabiliales bacterium]